MQGAKPVNGSSRIGVGSEANRASSWHNGRGWTPVELEELLNLSSTQTIRTIARKLGRTEKSVRRKLDQLGRTQELLTGFKTKDLARDLQVSICQVRRWRAKGYLDCVAGRITEESFEKFCRNHPEKISYRQLSGDIQLWLDGFGYPAGQGFRVGELAALLHVSPKTVRRWISLTWPQVKIIALSMHADPQYVAGMLEAGARGYLLKDADFDELLAAVRTVADGKTYVSPGLDFPAAASPAEHE